MSIRRATLEDADLLSELGAATFLAAYDDVSEEDMKAHVAVTFNRPRQIEELSQEGNAVFIAEADGTPVGYAFLRSGEVPDSIPGQRHIQIQRIYLMPEAKGRGLGAALLQRCLEEAKAMGRDVVWLSVWEGNSHAIAFYRSFGFEDSGTETFTVGTDSAEDLLMAIRV